MPRGLRQVALSISFLSPIVRRPAAFAATKIASLIFRPERRFLALTSFQSLRRPSLSFGSSSLISLRRQSLSLSRSALTFGHRRLLARAAPIARRLVAPPACSAFNIGLTSAALALARQGRSPDTIPSRLCQARGTVRRARRLVRLGHPAVSPGKLPPRKRGPI